MQQHIGKLRGLKPNLIQCTSMFRSISPSHLLTHSLTHSPNQLVAKKCFFAFLNTLSLSIYIYMYFVCLVIYLYLCINPF